MTIAIQKTGKQLPYIKRAISSANPALRELYLIMEEKKSNAAFCASFPLKQQIIDYVKAVGPYACMIQTHIDIVTDFDIYLLLELQELSRKHRFLLFEDRKFADSGAIVREQYDQGLYKIANWAHFVSVVPSALPIEGIRSIGLQMGRGCLVHIPLSGYSAYQQAQELIERHKDFVVGAFSSGAKASIPKAFSLKEGISRSEEEYFGEGATPEKVIAQGYDAFVVQPELLYENRVEVAKEMQQRGWLAYESLI